MSLTKERWEDECRQKPRTAADFSLSPLLPIGYYWFERHRRSKSHSNSFLHLITRMKSATTKILTLLVLLTLVGSGYAQTPDKSKTKPVNDPYAGYKKRKIEGFTVLLSDKVLEADVTKFVRKPVDVLEIE